MPAATIGDDYFRHHEAAHALIGDRTGEAYRLGDDVRVRLVEAIPIGRRAALRDAVRRQARRRPPAKAAIGPQAIARAQQAPLNALA